MNSWVSSVDKFREISRELHEVYMKFSDLRIDIQDLLAPSISRALGLAYDLEAFINRMYTNFSITSRGKTCISGREIRVCLDELKLDTH
jgi:hypothetical protein